MAYIFDEDCNVQDFAEVLFRIGANCDPGRDVLHTRGPVDQLDAVGHVRGQPGQRPVAPLQPETQSAFRGLAAEERAGAG